MWRLCENSTQFSADSNLFFIAKNHRIFRRGYTYHRYQPFIVGSCISLDDQERGREKRCFSIRFPGNSSERAIAINLCRFRKYIQGTPCYSWFYKHVAFPSRFRQVYICACPFMIYAWSPTMKKNGEGKREREKKRKKKKARLDDGRSKFQTHQRISPRIHTWYDRFLIIDPVHLHSPSRSKQRRDLKKNRIKKIHHSWLLIPWQKLEV